MPLIDKFEAPRPAMFRPPVESLIVRGVRSLMVLPVRLLANEIWSSPGFVDAEVIAALSEPLPESLALVTRMDAIDGVVESVPLTVRLVTTPKNPPPVIKVRFVGHEIGAETVIFPAVLLPIFKVPAVIWPISVADKPSVVYMFVPLPKLTPVSKRVVPLLPG